MRLQIMRSKTFMGAKEQLNAGKCIPHTIWHVNKANVAAFKQNTVLVNTKATTLSLLEVHMKTRQMHHQPLGHWQIMHR